MNKRQREVEEAKLAREKKILETLKQQYQRAARDIAEKIRLHTEKIDALLSEWDGLDEKQKSVLQSQIYQRNYQLMLQRQIDRMLEQMNRRQYEHISQYLKECHEMARAGTLYDLHGQNIPLMLPIEPEDAVKAAELDSKVSGKLYGSYVTELKRHIQAEITRGISAGLSYGEIARNLNAVTNIGLNKAMRIVRTEGHRIQQEGQFQAQQQAKEAGADIVKQWDATLDGLTRPTHRKLDGQIRELEEPFEADGKKAMYPGGFGRPEEDINCRCTLLQRANWALDEDELKILQERAAYFGLDKTKEFEAFRKQYLGNLQDRIKAAILSYMSAEAYKINEKLRRQFDLTLEEEAYIMELDAALGSMPTYQGSLQRSLYFHSEEELSQFLSAYTVGKTISYKEFLSTTKKGPYNPKGQVQIYIEHSQKGRDISRLNKAEQEVLYQRGASFKIKKIKLQAGIHHILLEEV